MSVGQTLEDRDGDSHKWPRGLSAALGAFGSGEEWGEGTKGGRGVGVFRMPEL